MQRAAFFAFAAVLVPLGCFNLDGFSGGPPAPSSDGGSEAATTSIMEAAAEASTDAATDPYGAAVFADNPAAFYRLEDAPGSTVIVDAMGAHPGMVDGNMTLGVPGAVGNAASFDGSGGFKLGDIFAFEGTSEFTIEFWAQDDNPTNDFEKALEKRDTNTTSNPKNGWVVFLDTSDRSLQFQFWAAGSVNEQTGTDGKVTGLHHTVITRTASGNNLLPVMYFDGVLQTNKDSYGSMGDEPESTTTLEVGPTWHGILDEIAFYDHALSAERALAHFQARP